MYKKILATLDEHLNSEVAARYAIHLANAGGCRGVEGPEAAVMKQPPRPLTKGLIERSLLFRGYIFLGLIGTMGVLSAYFHVLNWNVWHWGIELSMDNPIVRQASTATFLGIVVLQIGNVFACRPRTESVFKSGMFSNRMVLLGIVTELLLCLWFIYTSSGIRLFSTAPVGGCLASAPAVCHHTVPCRGSEKVFSTKTFFGHPIGRIAGCLIHAQLLAISSMQDKMKK